MLPVHAKAVFMRRPRKIQNAAGFTMVEILVVAALALVFMGVALPSFLSWLPTSRLSSAVRQVATDLQVARMRAIAQNTDNTVTFASNTYTYGSDSRDISQLYPGISIVQFTANPTFNSRGTANSVTIKLTNGTKEQWVCVKVVGRVNVQDTACS